jgi:acyl carrier protein
LKTLKYLARIEKLTAEQRQKLAARLTQEQAEAEVGQRLLAYVVPRSGAAVSEAEVREFVQQKLPDYMVPSVVIFLESLPLLPNGKVDRKALPSLAQVRPVAKGGGIAPRNEIEEQVARIWAAVLGAERVGVHDNFFQLGGHSLLALQVMARLRETFHTDVPLKRLFETPTVAGLAEAVEQSKQGRLAAPIRRISRPAAASVDSDLEPAIPRSESAGSNGGPRRD